MAFRVATIHTHTQRHAHTSTGRFVNKKYRRRVAPPHAKRVITHLYTLPFYRVIALVIRLALLSAHEATTSCVLCYIDMCVMLVCAIVRYVVPPMPPTHTMYLHQSTTRYALDVMYCSLSLALFMPRLHSLSLSSALHRLLSYCKHRNAQTRNTIASVMCKTNYEVTGIRAV